MSIYHKCLSRFLISFSALFIIFLLFIETNAGFKWIFNLTSRFFLGFKVEEILGNWRDFTLKNINYSSFGMTIQADSIHVVLDIKSLFRTSTIIKDIKTKNVIIIFKENKYEKFLRKEKVNNFIEKNKHIKYSILFKNIHIDKILMKTSKVHFFLSNIFLTSISLSNNNITIFPTYIDNVKVLLLNSVNLKKNIRNNNFINIKKIHNFLSFSFAKKKFFIPFNINLIFLHCKKTSFVNYKSINSLEIKIQAKLQNNVLNIKNIMINSNFLRLKSFGKIIFYNNRFSSCIIHNTILLPRFYDKIIDISLKICLDKELKIQLHSNHLYNTNLIAKICLDNFNNSFYLNFNSKHLFFPIKEDFVLNLKNFNIILSGNINNYSLFIKNTFKLKDMRSILIKIHAQGRLKNIFLKKFEVFPIKKIIFHKENNNLKRNTIYNDYILDLMGRINVLGSVDQDMYNISFSKINLNSNIMKKKISILGSLYYRNFNFLDIPGIEFLLGKNKLHIQGTLGKTFNINSSIYANDLNYLSPNLKGIIKSKSNIYGDHVIPMSITSKTSIRNVNINNIYLKSFKIFADISFQNTCFGRTLIDAKKIYFSKFHIDSLFLKANWGNNKQNIFFLFKSKMLSLNLTINGMYDHKTGNWNGFFKKIKIHTFLGKLTIKDSPVIFYYNLKNKKNNIYKKNLPQKEIFSSFLDYIKMSFSNIFKQSFMNFETTLFVNGKLKWGFGKRFNDGKLLLTTNNIKFKKKTKENLYSESIDYIRWYTSLRKDNLQNKWVLKKSINSLEKTNIFGYLNITDIYNKKNIEGKLYISNFPVSIINFFTKSFKKVQGTFKSNITFFGTLYCPKILSTVNLQNIFINSDNLLQYITLFFPYFSGKTDLIKINQSVLIQKADILFTLNTVLKKSNHIEWKMSFKSEKIAISIFHKIQITCSSHLKLHYLFEKYDLIGYIKFPFFYLNINEKNFFI
ncbi:translocation/assembly module TamB [Buchnera aphidicola]|uniref:Translocation/assembly module TamB n=1 Tax=Buchnera aphidicola (Lipaphis pseudobrassicae) TaxID=1258543 RepID=A0A4D6XZZ4_9GAMM|nr:translocation/assembly module TamB [Buchnera aphidicola]QCI21977.1 translocation/assembly module TamB [Buchnera aphidicola (Lipaphis pseudobrassicae)]